MEVTNTRAIVLFLVLCVCLVSLYSTQPWISTQVPTYWNSESVYTDEGNTHMAKQLTTTSRTTMNKNFSSTFTTSASTTLPACWNSSCVSNVPRVVWAFWFGRPMQGERLQAWKSLKANIGVPLTLVTDDTLSDYNISSHPIHPALSLKRGLSMIHRGDYLRVYFMHHFGGGYHDVKPHQTSWKNSFDVFRNPDVWVYGVPEGSPADIACANEYAIDSHACAEKTSETKDNTTCCKLIKSSWKSLVSNGAYIIRPNTNLTYEWLTGIERHLTDKYGEIQAHPAPKPRCCLPSGYNYPIRWAELHGEIFHPLQFKYKGHVRHGLPKWSMEPYRDVNSESAVYDNFTAV